MKFQPLGGANEIGASSTLIEIENSRILVDVGMRMGPGQNAPIPDFPDFNKVGIPDAVLLTHAHTDHTGALPVLHNMLSADVKIYCTPATKAITKVLLEDSARRMEREKHEKGKTPKYVLKDVKAVLKRMETVGWLKIEVCPGVTATWIPAGHILGAAMIHIEGKEGSILITGDVSATNQLTIPGMAEKLPYQPDIMVMESTYGNRQHKDRIAQTASLVSDVAAVIQKGGKVLIPAFAVGRSQEVILILKQAMERRQIPEFPVYVDGMVRDVNRIYSDFAQELSPALKRKAERDEHIFYSDVIQPVRQGTQCQEILSGEPCCIIASSGMLIGGKSVAYAKALVRDPNNLIAITGYQAEGTPGRALLDCVKAGEPADTLWEPKGCEPLRVQCEVKRYSLSAHADRNELRTLVENVQPRTLFLVHGDQGARKALSKSIRQACPAVDVKLPKNGQAYTIRIGISRGRRLSHDRILSEVAAFVRKMGWERPFRVRELAEIWFGTEELTPIAVKFFEWCLSLEGRFFENGPDDLLHLR